MESCDPRRHLIGFEDRLKDRDRMKEKMAKSDEAFTRNLAWEHSWSLVSAERGDLENEFIEITEGEANQIVDRIRATVTGTSNG